MKLQAFPVNFVRIAKPSVLDTKTNCIKIPVSRKNSVQPLDKFLKKSYNNNIVNVIECCLADDSDISVILRRRIAA